MPAAKPAKVSDCGQEGHSLTMKQCRLLCLGLARRGAASFHLPHPAATQPPDAMELSLLADCLSPWIAATPARSALRGLLYLNSVSSAIASHVEIEWFIAPVGRRLWHLPALSEEDRVFLRAW